MNHTVVLRTPLDTAKVKAAGLKRLPFSEGLFETVSATASLESADLEAPAPFDDLVASLAAVVPDGAEAELSRARARTPAGRSGTRSGPNAPTASIRPSPSRTRTARSMWTP